ncbi:DUF1517 domain-containing protein [Acaryochloris marina]|uniref:DUF1517 domain-containing protein n=1 Tax=Acaryochloris marina (strain MBIC 11017) TaxID=329726 RepID=B0C0D1_ACAM1|nr:DUF1517 domain-containing protein [Acaryochloris marina]ABW29623.1 conserved hypothetical protein [Acaryochloris marina MBIC11017]BDM78525.1 hypothetical protein AM10699_13940 [Acaryochloris marina MBIC10699]
MNKKRPIYKTFSRLLVAIALVGVLVFSNADAALAARTGGRISGGSFRRSVPSRSYRSSPSRGYSGGYSRGGYARGGYGGGFGFPFLIPFFGFGGGGLFSILILIAVANFLVSSFRNIAGDGEGISLRGNSYDQNAANPSVTVSKIQVGLLAEARGLKADLDRIAQTGNTGSSTGLAKVLQETNLALLRHPEYWVYASAESEQTRLVSAEAKFNHLALTERSKFQAETLSNVKQQIQDTIGTLTKTPDTLTQAPGEYIVVTLVVAAQGKQKLPDIKSDQDLRQALNQVGSVSSDQLLALEVLWTPQAESDTLSADDLVAAYPHLKMI